MVLTTKQRLEQIKEEIRLNTIKSYGPYWPIRFFAYIGGFIAGIGLFVGSKNFEPNSLFSFSLFLLIISVILFMFSLIEEGLNRKNKTLFSLFYR